MGFKGISKSFRSVSGDMWGLQGCPKGPHEVSMHFRFKDALEDSRAFQRVSEAFPEVSGGFKKFQVFQGRCRGSQRVSGLLQEGIYRGL